MGYQIFPIRNQVPMLLQTAIDFYSILLLLLWREREREREENASGKGHFCC